MSNRAFLILVIAVGVLVAAGIYLHRPRPSSRAVDVHGTR